MPAVEYLKKSFNLHLAHRWWILAVITMILIGMSIVNLNFLIVALIAILVVSQMIFSYGHFIHLLSPICIESIMRCRIKIDEHSLTREFYDEDDNFITNKIHVWNEYDRVVISNKYLQIYRKNSKYDFDLIPLNAFSEEDLKSVVDLIHKTLND